MVDLGQKQGQFRRRSSPCPLLKALERHEDRASDDTYALNPVFGHIEDIGPEDEIDMHPLPEARRPRKKLVLCRVALVVAMLVVGILLSSSFFEVFGGSQNKFTHKLRAMSLRSVRILGEAQTAVCGRDCFCRAAAERAHPGCRRYC